MSNNLSKTRPAFRTTGAITGNFGKAKVKSGSQLNEIPANQRDSIGNFPTMDEYEQRLLLALERAEDRKLHHFLVRELEKIRAKRGGGERTTYPIGPYCSINDHFIDSSK